MMKKRLFILLTALVAMVTTAGAVNYGISFCGISITNDDKDDIAYYLRLAGYTVPSGASASYNPSTKTLTLNNWSGSGYTYGLIVEESFTGTLTLKVNGDCRLPSISLRGTNDLNINGSGTLTIFEQYGCQINGVHKVTINSANVNIQYKWTKNDFYDRISLVVNGGWLYVGEIGFNFSSVTLTDCVMTEPSSGSNNVSGKTVRIRPEYRDDPQISWSQSSVNINKNQSYTLPSFRNPKSLTGITFTSSNLSVASVSSSGTISLGSGTGSAVITATFNGNASYKPAQVTTTLTTYSGSLMERTIYWSESEVTVVMGETFNAPTLTVEPNPGSGHIYYKSSTPSVAMISDWGTVTIKSPGQTTITANIKALNNYNACSASYELYVYGYYDMRWRVETYQATVGNTKVRPSSIGFTDVTYYSSNTDVAEVDENGYVTAKAAGTAVITAEREGEGYYLTTTASYTLVVERQNPINRLYWSNGVKNDSYTVAYGEYCYAKLSNALNLPVSYASSNTTVATIDDEGKVTPLAVGEAVITAIFDGDDTYEPVTRSFTLTVTPPKPKINWPKSATTGHLGSTFDSPTLNNPNNVPVSYTSSDPTVATIDETGNVTLLSIGKTTISAIFDGNETYVPSTVTYQLTVIDVYWTKEYDYLAIGRSFRPELVNLSGREVNITVSGDFATYDPETGFVTGVSKGSCKIYASEGNGSVSMNLHICPVGDANHSRTLSSTDVTSMIQKITGSSDNTVAPYAPEDVNGDGRLDIIDVALLIELLKAQ